MWHRNLCHRNPWIICAYHTSLYLHIAQSQDQDTDNISKPFKSTQGRGGKKSGKGKQKSLPPPPEEEEQ